MNLRGTGVALVTPFLEDYSVDYGTLERLISYQIDNGTDYLVVQGTTGEAATLTAQERQEVMDYIVHRFGGRIPMVLGMSGNATGKLCQEIENADFTGYDAILTVTPYYNRPSQEGLYRHFAAVANASPIPVVLYNVPSRTGSNLEAETTLRLAHDFPGQVIGIKEASGRLGQIRRLIEEKPEGFQIVSGDDALTLPLIALGAEGVISVAVNALPRKFNQMVHDALEGRFKEAAALDRPLQAVYRALFAEGNPAGIKCMLSLMGYGQNVLRLPLVRVSKELEGTMAGLLERHAPELGLNLAK